MWTQYCLGITAYNFYQMVAPPVLLFIFERVSLYCRKSYECQYFLQAQSRHMGGHQVLANVGGKSHMNFWPLIIALTFDDLDRSRARSCPFFRSVMSKKAFELLPLIVRHCNVALAYHGMFLGLILIDIARSRLDLGRSRSMSCLICLLQLASPWALDCGSLFHDEELSLKPAPILAK